MKLGGSWDGTAFGPGTDVHVMALEGLDDLPPRRNTDQARPSGGSVRGQDVREARSITAQFGLIGIDDDDYEDRRAEYLLAFRETSDERELFFDDSTRMVWASIDSRRVPVEADTVQRTAVSDVVFSASDPSVFAGGDESTVSVAASGTGTALAGGVGPSNSWRVEIPGPQNHPHIEVTGPDGVCIIDLDVTVASGDTLVITRRGPHGRPSIYPKNTGTGVIGTPILGSAVDGDGKPAIIAPLSEGARTFKFSHSSGSGPAVFSWRDRVE